MKYKAITVRRDQIYEKGQKDRASRLGAVIGSRFHPTATCFDSLELREIADFMDTRRKEAK